MSEAREKAVHKLAAVLTAFAASHVPDNAKRFVDAVLRSGPADPALVGALRATFRALGLVAVPAELVAALPPSRSASGCSGPCCDDDGPCERCNAKLDLADAVPAQLGAAK